MFFGDPLPRLFQSPWFVKKHGCLGRGLFYLYIYIKKTLIIKSEALDRFIIQKSIWSELGWNFNNKYANLFAQASDIRPSWSSCLLFYFYFSDKLRLWQGRQFYMKSKVLFSIYKKKKCQFCIVLKKS